MSNYGNGLRALVTKHNCQKDTPYFDGFLLLFEKNILPLYKIMQLKSELPSVLHKHGIPLLLFCELPQLDFCRLEYKLVSVVQLWRILQYRGLLAFVVICILTTPHPPHPI